MPVYFLGLVVVAAQTEHVFAERLYVAADVYSTDVVWNPKVPTEIPALAPEALVDAARKRDVLYRKARIACEQGDVGAALRMATEIVSFAPNDADARRVLGYRRLGDHWAGSYAARRLNRDEAWHPQFGWIEIADVSRYEAGQRPLGNRWISAEEDARRHDSMRQGWQVRTDHFRVLTNTSREKAAQLAMRLESLYQVWQQLFGGFHLKPIDLLKRFDGKAVSGYRTKPFEVNYYRTREQYNGALRRQQPRIAMTLGIYFDTTRKTHFFAPSQQDPSTQYVGTIYHEAVHQFFQESAPTARSVGAGSNAWLIEGVACYFESLLEHHSEQGQPYFTIGTPTAGRLPAARHRRLVDDFYVPLAELSELGIADFQRRSDLPRLYSQSAGLVTFLMHFQDASYRPALVKLLQLLYAGRDQPSTLEGLTGKSFAELDREYRHYLEALPVATSAGLP